ncbi:disease resistance protein At4g27190-like isoform X3 [Carica papaya]|uniref:disease resistance protein At4g27190-like isoform X3 n=1 Tax=Carica papaya TaxID=3649 RepID=UPI000B8CFEC6|nr:disease resistance protein At4g27190-like isoform X3 [Carica papaya]
MELAVEFVTAFSSVLVDHSVASVGRQIGYLLKYKTNIEDLKNQLQKLKDERDKVQHWVDDATRRGEEIEAVVQRWLDNVDKNIEEGEKVIRKAEERAQKEWFRRSLRSRYRVGRRAAKETETIVKLNVESSFERVSYRPLPQGIGITSVKGYEDFNSRKHTLNGVIEALKDPNIGMVGIYGMGGIGKTTLAKEVASKVKQEGEFPVLVFVEVSQEQDIKKIQGEIADKLGLEFREETLSGRADRLCDRLKKEKRILIILDNLWEKLDLEKVGIPFGEAHKECKILVTSRDQNVLSREMETQKNFPVGILPEKEAWELFKKMASSTVENPDLQVTATEVAKECAGLPLAIVTVAKALKNKSSSEWKNALLDLRRPSSRNFTGIQAVIYSTIELSYNNLETEELKATFLLCGIIGNTIIMDLLKYGIGLGVFQETKTMEETRDRVNSLLCNLEASCLLVDRSTNDQFAIHDVVRDVALSIASRDKHVLTIKNSVGPREWPYADSTGILLLHSDIRELPEEMEYPKLKFICIWNPSLELPENFLNRMRELRVLDFTEMRIPSLPSSICLLANLRSLCLYSCVLQEITIIGELTKLEILSFVDCDVEQLPKELGQLTRLQLLDLSDCPKIKVIPRGVISSLCRLEELYLGNSFKLWENEDLRNQTSNASLAELRCLPNLTALDIHIPNIQIMLNDLFSERLTKYRIFMGDEWDWHGKYETERTLKLKHGTSFLLEDGMYKLLEKTEDLYLDELKGEPSILWKLDREGLPQLKHLHVHNSPDIRYIINTMDDPWISSKAFPILASLFLQNMINLEKICHGKFPVGSFSKLRIIKVGSCGRLESLFSFSLFKDLVELQEIEVTDCEKMLGIVAEERLVAVVDNEARSNVELCQLHSLTLKNLSSFISFCHMDSPSTSWSTMSNSMPLLDEKFMKQTRACRFDSLTWKN